MLFGAIPSSCALIFYFIYGEYLLSLFDEKYVEFKSVLLILSLGYWVNSLCGPTAQLMEMTIFQNEMFKVLTIVNVIGLATIPVAATYFATAGIAWVVTTTIALWNIWCVIFIRKKLGFDPSVLGLLANRSSV